MTRKTPQIHVEPLYGTLVYSERKAVRGVTELPPDFVAVKDDRVMIAGYPHADVIQLAYAGLGFKRAHLTRRERGEGLTGLMVDLVA